MADQNENTVEISLASLKVTNPDNVRSIYTNHAAVTVTNWDFRFLFAEIVPAAESFEIQMRSQIVMTPAHAKAFAIVLNQHLALYEKANGEIKWPPKQLGKNDEQPKRRHPQSR